MGSSFEGGYTTPTIDQQSGPKPAKISTRRESGRQKKVNNFSCYCNYFNISNKTLHFFLFLIIQTIYDYHNNKCLKLRLKPSGQSRGRRRVQNGRPVAVGGRRRRVARRAHAAARQEQGEAVRRAQELQRDTQRALLQEAFCEFLCITKFRF